MLCITVAQDGSGDFASISEAVLAVPYDCPAQIRIGAGIYREKLVCEKKDIALQGAGADCTRLVWGDGGKLPHPDGRPTHTFRSYTAFFSGERLRVEDLTIKNDAGPGAKGGPGRGGLCRQRPCGVREGAAAGQSGYAVLRPSAGEGAGEGRLPRPARPCSAPGKRPVLPRL